MKVTTFRIEYPECIPEGNPVFGNQTAVYKIPTLPAYALIDSQLKLDSNQHINIDETSVIYSLNKDSVEVPNRHGNLFGPPSGLLTVYHNGIKDFKLLFPHVKEVSLMERMGNFAEEAENCFQSKSWISYCLMVGAVLEGLLFDKFGNLKFNQLIENARDYKIISEDEAVLIDRVRLARNKIHANRHKETIVDRAMALELSVAYDRLIKRNWEN